MRCRPVGALGGAGGGAAVGVTLVLFAARRTLAPEGFLLTVSVTRPLPEIREHNLTHIYTSIYIYLTFYIVL